MIILTDKIPVSKLNKEHIFYTTTLSNESLEKLVQYDTFMVFKPNEFIRNICKKLTKKFKKIILFIDEDKDIPQISNFDTVILVLKDNNLYHFNRLVIEDPDTHTNEIEVECKIEEIR